MSVRSNNCPCCGNSLLRHIRHAGVYWFCTSCRQEVPLLTERPLPLPIALPLPNKESLNQSLHLKEPVSS
jgi:hypothetical protein